MYEEANPQCLQKCRQLVESLHPDNKPRATLDLACTSRECTTAVSHLMSLDATCPIFPDHQHMQSLPYC